MEAVGVSRAHSRHEGDDLLSFQREVCGTYVSPLKGLAINLSSHSQRFRAGLQPHMTRVRVCPAHPRFSNEREVWLAHPRVGTDLEG